MVTIPILQGFSHPPFLLIFLFCVARRILRGCFHWQTQALCSPAGSGFYYPSDLSVDGCGILSLTLQLPSTPGPTAGCWRCLLLVRRVQISHSLPPGQGGIALASGHRWVLLQSWGCWRLTLCTLRSAERTGPKRTPQSPSRQRDMEGWFHAGSLGD